MNPFEPGGGEIPPAPFDIPTPDIPAANFVDIGQQVGQGVKKSGVFSDLVQVLLDGIADIVGKIAAAILALIESIIAYLLKIVFKSFELSEAGTNEIAAIVVGGMTGVPVSAAQFANAKDRGSRESVAIGLINAIQNALAAGQPGAGGGELQPGKTGAEEFLKLTSHMAIEGWLIGWLADTFSVHELEHLGDLKETLEASLGLGRLARRALAAPMKILVEDPYTWLLNTAYRPTLPAVEVLVRQYLRGILTRTDLDKWMGYHGYAPANVEALINYSKVHLSVGDIETLKLQGDIDDNTALTLLKAQGYDDFTAASALRALGASRHNTWARLLVQEALNGLTTRQITPADFDQYLNNSGLPADEKSILTLYANLKLQFARKRFSISEGETLVKKGLWTLDQFRQLATDLGYNTQDELDLELLTLVEIKDASDAAAKKAAAEKARADAAAVKAAAAKAKAANAANAAEAKGVSLAKYEALVLDGQKTIDQYKLFLAGKSIAADNITALVTVLQAKLDKAAQAAQASAGLASAAKAKNLDLAQLESAVKAGALTLAEFGARLLAIGFQQSDIDLLSTVLQDGLDAAKVKADAKAAAAAKAKTKGVDLAQEERAVRLGLQTIDAYSAKLDSLGYAQEDRDLLVAELQAQLAADAAARQKKQEVATKAQSKGLSLSQLEQSVRAGLTTIDQYRTALAQLGYDATAQDQLVSLLQLRMQADQEELAAKGRAAALIGKSGLSLADIERAVKLGVVAITVYSDALTKAGVSAADAKVLTLSLAAQTKSTKQALATFAAVAKQLKLIGRDLSQLVQQVLDATLTIDQLQAILAGAGIADADVQTVIALVKDELANAQHVDQLTGSVAATAASKGLSLAQETDAVKAGVKTLDDYRSFVAALGYSPADVATLAGTLATKLKPPATATPAPAPGAP